MRATLHSAEHITDLREGQRLARARMATGEGFIYVAAIDASTVKVGFSLRPERRVEQLGKSVRLLGYFPASIRAERELHRLLRNHATDRECYPRSLFEHAIRPDYFGKPKRAA